MKVIFLDIDGVLNTTETFIRRRMDYDTTGIFNLEIDTFRLEHLKKIIDKTGAKIVLSSTWRRFFKKEFETIIPTAEKGIDLFNLFSEYGIEIYDITAINNEGRENQIKEWLSNRDDIDNFIIIDDETNKFNELLDKLIKTSKAKEDKTLMSLDDCDGLSKKHIDEIVDRLNKKEKVLIK